MGYIFFPLNKILLYLRPISNVFQRKILWNENGVFAYTRRYTNYTETKYISRKFFFYFPPFFFCSRPIIVLVIRSSVILRCFKFKRLFSLIPSLFYVRPYYEKLVLFVLHSRSYVAKKKSFIVNRMFKLLRGNSWGKLHSSVR